MGQSLVYSFAVVRTHHRLLSITMPRPIITFTTDFGVESPYVAEMKGVALSLCGEAQLIDITHAVPPQNIACGAFFLAQAAPRFPSGSIHVAVVDPGVGTPRKILVAQAGGRFFVAPDNGLLSRVVQWNGLEAIVEAGERWFEGEHISRTFHGRDIMTPLAARLANGASLAELGPACTRFVDIPWPKVVLRGNRTTGEVVAVDSFGNLLTNLRESHIGARPAATVGCGNVRGIPLVNTYGDAPRESLVALIGSSGWLEVAEVGGSAATRLAARCGALVYVE